MSDLQAWFLFFWLLMIAWGLRDVVRELRASRVILEAIREAIWDIERRGR